MQLQRIVSSVERQYDVTGEAENLESYMFGNCNLEDYQLLRSLVTVQKRTCREKLESPYTSIQCGESKIE